MLHQLLQQGSHHTAEEDKGKRCSSQRARETWPFFLLENSDLRTNNNVGKQCLLLLAISQISEQCQTLHDHNSSNVLLYFDPLVDHLIHF
jgi:hypothetical protein